MMEAFAGSVAGPELWSENYSVRELVSSGIRHKEEGEERVAKNDLWLTIISCFIRIMESVSLFSSFSEDFRSWNVPFGHRRIMKFMIIYSVEVTAKREKQHPMLEQKDEINIFDLRKNSSVRFEWGWFARDATKANQSRLSSAWSCPVAMTRSNPNTKASKFNMFRMVLRWRGLQWKLRIFEV